MIKRRKARTITIGTVKVGSGHPVSIQSMTKTDTVDVDATAGQINLLEKAGCEIVRVAVKDMAAAKALSGIRKRVNIPVVADIHFDYRLALESIEQGVDKIRLNPGNIIKEREINSVISAAAEKNIPIRIGVNSGSLPGNKAGTDKNDERMVGAALRYADIFRKKNFEDIIFSLKAPDVETTVKAYRKIAAKVDYPLHLGVTAAGSSAEGVVRSSVGIGALLLDGIGDTIRVSLTGEPVQEIETAKRILSSAGVRYFYPQVISCPTCGRCRVDLAGLVKELEKKIKRRKNLNRLYGDKPLVVAVMGCEVNGPGEAMNADVGIAFGRKKGAIFKHGKIVKTVREEEAINELLIILEEGTE